LSSSEPLSEENVAALDQTDTRGQTVAVASATATVAVVMTASAEETAAAPVEAVPEEIGEKKRPALSGPISSSNPKVYATPITEQSSFTASALLFSAVCSSAVSLISIICSSPFAPSLQGTPTYSPEMPYSP
jgi:hypothetical protein